MSTHNKIPEQGNEVDISKPLSVEELLNNSEGGPPVRQVTAVVIGLGQVRTLLTLIVHSRLSYRGHI